MESLSEVVGFLDHEKDEVRKMAIDAIADLSLDEDIKAQFGHHPNYLNSLISRLDDRPLIALSTWKALINLSKNSIIAASLAKLVPQTVSVLADKTSPFAEFAAMLLSNISQNESSHGILVENLHVLFPIFLSGREHNPKASFDVLANVFGNVSCHAQARAFFMDNNFTNLFKIVSQARSSQILRRGGAVITFKNCLFDPEIHKGLFNADDDEDLLLSTLLGMLASPESKFDQEEIDSMLLDIQLEYRFSPAEADPTIRAIVLEVLLLLGTTRFGRDRLREKNVYPILREWHTQEPEEALQELLEKVVELLIRDEE